MEKHQESNNGAAEAADLPGEAVAPVAESVTEEPVSEEVTAEEATGDHVEEVQEAEAAPSPAAIIEQLEAELAGAREEAAANLEQMKRVAAEFQNSKRRQEKQLADAIDRAGAQFVQSALPILDDFDLAFQNVPEGLDGEDAAWLDGFRQIQRKLTDLLAA
jgi:molecular chaperone GrpE